MKTDVCYRYQLNSDDEIGKIERGSEIGKQEGKSVENTAEECCNSDNNTAYSRVSSPRVFPSVRKRFGERHADSGAGRGCGAN